MLGYHTFVTKKNKKKRTNVILKLLKNQERGSLMKSIITEEIKLRGSSTNSVGGSNLTPN